MDKISDTTAKSRRVCPTCGSRVGAGARRCIVCGADLTKPGPDPTHPPSNAASKLLLNLLPLGALVVFIGMGALFLFGALGVVSLPELPTRVPSATATGTETPTPTPTFTPTPTPPPTPLPAFEYVIKPGDSILELAYRYDIPTWVINEMNRLQPDSVLSVGMTILIPRPSPTPPPQPSPTPLATDTPGP